MGVSVARWGERRSTGKALDAERLGGSKGSMRGMKSPSQLGNMVSSDTSS